MGKSNEQWGNVQFSSENENLIWSSSNYIGRTCALLLAIVGEVKYLQ